MGIMDKPLTTWQLAGATALLGTVAATVPNSETLSVATAIAATSMVVSPVRRWANSFAERLPLGGLGSAWATRSNFNTAAAAAVLVTAFNTIGDGGTVDNGLTFLDGLQVAATDTYVNTVTPAWETLDSAGDTIKTVPGIVLGAFNAPTIEDGIVGRRIDLAEHDIGNLLRQAISPFEEVETPETFNILD